MADAFKVLTIDELTRVSDAGGLEPYYRHKIKTKAGVVLTVNIDKEDFTEAKVAAILTKKAIEVDKIKNL